MRKLLILITALMSLASFTPVLAMDGNELLEACQPQPDNAVGAYNEGTCLGFVIAVTETAILDKKVCIPEGTKITDGQVVDMFLKHMADHPERRVYAASNLVRYPLTVAYPCKQTP